MLRIPTSEIDGQPLPARTSGRPAIVVDLFCGAGSLSTGINDALVELGHAPKFTAVNHWDVATKTYARNHPGARVHCVTLDAAFPSRLVPEGYVDLLTAGIECTYFSRARGGKPVNDQQRMSAWHVVRWCTELRVRRLLLENVPEFVEWGPVDPRTGKPLKSRKGEYFRAWVEALRSIGYNLEWRVLNCADYGDATTRRRLFMLAAADRKAVVWPAPTHARRGAAGGLQPWRSAREIIDWSVIGASIFDRRRPLAPKTLARIAAGVARFRWPEPFIVVLRQHCDARGIDLPLPTITAGGTHLGLIQPFVLSPSNEGAPRDVADPLPTITLGGAGHVERPGCARHALIEPFVLSQASGGAARCVAEPMPTIPCGGAHALIAPYYGSGSGETCSSTDDPLPTATTKARFGLVTPIAAAAREYDIRFRMLEPHELAAAMSISTPERPYHFSGNKTEVVRQIGQAVPRRTGRALALALMGGR